MWNSAFYQTGHTGCFWSVAVSSKATWCQQKCNCSLYIKQTQWKALNAAPAVCYSPKHENMRVLHGLLPAVVNFLFRFQVLRHFDLHIITCVWAATLNVKTNIKSWPVAEPEGLWLQLQQSQTIKDALMETEKWISAGWKGGAARHELVSEISWSLVKGRPSSISRC